MTRLSKFLFTAISLGALAGNALAQDDGGEGGGEAGGEVGGEVGGEAGMEAGAGAEAGAGVDAGGAATGDAAGDAAAMGMTGMPPLTLGAGKIVIHGSTVNINMSSEAVAKPIFFSPGVSYGVNEKLTVGITHDGGSTPFTPRPNLAFTTIDVLGTPVTVPTGAGICISGEENGCPKVYNNIGFDALFGLKADKFSLAAHPGLDIASISDPLLLQLRVGVLGRFALNEKMALVFDPRIRIGITERDFNKEAIDIPVWFWFTASDKLGVYGHTGISGPLDGFGDAYAVPLQVGGNFMVNENLTAGLDFSFLNLLGKGGDADVRILGLRAIYAL